MKTKFNNAIIQPASRRGRQFNNRGFTLVEVIVVILIFSVLVSMSLIAINPIKQLQKARDAQRQHDMSQIRNSLELYYNDKNCYPSSLAMGAPFNSDSTIYMQKVPQDPDSPSNYPQYVYETNKDQSCPQWGVLFAKLSSTQGLQTTCPLKELTDSYGNTCVPVNYDSLGYNYCVLSGEVDCNYITATAPTGTSTPGPTGTPVPTVIPTPTPTPVPTPTPTPTSTPTPTPAPGSFSQYIEAENFTLSPPMISGSDTSAWNGQYISPTSGVDSSTPVREAYTSISLTTSGGYYLWARMMGPTNASDALYLGFDSGWDRKVPSVIGAYEWVRVRSYATNLTAGSHIIQAGHGEINARLDTVFVTNDANAVPIQSTPTPVPTPTPTPTPTTFTITGNVYIDTNRNGAKDTGEANASGVTVTASGTGGGTRTTDTSGNYSFTGISSGSYTVTLTVPAGNSATTTNPRTVSVGPSTTVNFGYAPTLTTKSVTVSSIAALKTALLDNTVDEIVVVNGTYGVSPAAVKTANSLWIGSAYAGRTRPILVRAETIGNVIFNGGGGQLGGIMFEEGAHHQTWQGFKFTNGSPRESGVITFGGYSLLAPPHHITLLDITVSGLVKSPTGTGFQGYPIYFSMAAAPGPHDILIDRFTSSDDGALLGAHLHFYHDQFSGDPAGNYNVQNVVIRNARLTGTPQPVIIWARSITNLLIEDTTISGAGEYAIRYEYGSAITLRRVTSTGSGRGGFYSSLGANPPQVTFIDTNLK